MEKDNFNANVDFVRGQADMIVLSALSDNDMYGLEILNTIQEKSQGMYSLKQATLYSSLKRLEKNGYVHSYDGDVSNGAKRVYYGLTEQGREHLSSDRSYWEFSSFLMSSLISDNKFDPQNDEKPFDPADFRPLTRRNKASSDNEKVVIKYVYLPQGSNPEVENQVDESLDDNTALLKNNEDELEQVEDKNDEIEEVEAQVAEIEEVEENDSIADFVTTEVVDDESVEDIDEQSIEEIVADIAQENIEENIVVEETIEDFESENEDQLEEKIEEVFEEQQVVEQEKPSPIYQRKLYFDENTEVNYISSFSDMFNSIPEDIPIDEEKENVEYLTMKEMVYKFQSKGVSVKPYDKKDTMEFYVNRYYYSNKLHLHVSLIIFAVLALELIISHFICNRNVNDRIPGWALFLGILAVALYPVARYVLFLIDPTKKTPANYNPKTSLLLSMLPIITLPIVFALMAFVQFGANINDYASMERTIVLPSIMLFNVPLYFVVFSLLYRTYRYHVN